MRLGRLAAVSLGACLALPASAAGGAPPDDPGAPPSHARSPDLAVVPPSAPILGEAEGADSSGGATIVTSALYGGLAGALVGTGVALIENGNWGRDIAIGAGVGILVGGALGAAHAFGDSRPLPATDGMGSTVRDPPIQGYRLAFGGRF